MKIIKLLIWSLAICVLSLNLGCAKKMEDVAIEVQYLQGPGKVYFVPLDDFPLPTVEKLVNYYQDEYKLQIQILPSLTLDSSVENLEREQLSAEAIIISIKKGYPNLVSDPQTILIGLTEEDIYTDKYNWRFTFSLRQDKRFAVISNARMILDAPLASAEKQELRLRKMVTKNIGIMYYHLPQNDNPRSVLYSDIGGVQELDYMGEEF